MTSESICQDFIEMYAHIYQGNESDINSFKKDIYFHTKDINDFIEQYLLGGFFTLEEDIRKIINDTMIFAIPTQDVILKKEVFKGTNVIIFSSAFIEIVRFMSSLGCITIKLDQIVTQYTPEEDTILTALNHLESDQKIPESVAAEIVPAHTAASFLIAHYANRPFTLPLIDLQNAEFKRYINTNFIFSILFCIFHEIGHIYYGHLSYGQKAELAKKNEYEADLFVELAVKDEELKNLVLWAGMMSVIQIKTFDQFFKKKSDVYKMEKTHPLGVDRQRSTMLNILQRNKDMIPYIDMLNEYTEDANPSFDYAVSDLILKNLSISDCFDELNFLCNKLNFITDGQMGIRLEEIIYTLRHRTIFGRYSDATI